MNEDLTELEGEWVSAHRPDRMGSVVVGCLQPYNGTHDVVIDENGHEWAVVSNSIRRA